MSRQHSNSTKSTGINITEATPIDDRLYYNTLADLLNDTLLDPSELLPVLFDGIVIHIKESRLNYIWKESAYGAMGAGYTYPPYATNVRGQNYSNKTYNFVLYGGTAKFLVKYTSIALAGLIIPKAELPDHLLTDLNNMFAVMRSSADGFVEQQFPSHIDVGANDITIILDPKPELNEEFKITLT
jgi:hypothetical protein